MVKLALGFWVFVMIIILFGTIGWVMNIVKLSQLNFNAPYKAEVIRVVGVFTPIGGLTGWMEIKDN